MYCSHLVMRRLSPRTTWLQARLAIKTIFAVDPFNPVHPVSLLSSLSSQTNVTFSLYFPSPS